MSSSSQAPRGKRPSWRVSHPNSIPLTQRSQYETAGLLLPRLWKSRNIFGRSVPTSNREVVRRVGQKLTLYAVARNAGKDLLTNLIVGTRLRNGKKRTLTESTRRPMDSCRAKGRVGGATRGSLFVFEYASWPSSSLTDDLECGEGASA